MTILARKIYDDNGYVCERHVLAKDTLKKNRARKLGHFAIDVLQHLLK